MFMQAMNTEQYVRIAASVVILVSAWIIKMLFTALAKRNFDDMARFHHWRRVIVYSCSVTAIVLIGGVWFERVQSFAAVLSVTVAALVIVMRDSINDLVAWMYIMSRQPFKIGDRIQTGDIIGDVIDIRLFKFSVIEVGNWVDADQNTGRIVHIPNRNILREPLANYETGFEYIWHEIPVTITFESNWRKAKDLLTQIAHEKVEHLSEGAEEQIRSAAMKYLIFFSKLTPIVYTSVRENGVLLTVRYIVKPRQRRNSEQDIWEAILAAFAQQDDIAFAYPTTRFFASEGSSFDRHGGN